MTLMTSLTKANLTPRWMYFVWNQGGGILLPLPPFYLGQYDSLIVPLGLWERIISIHDQGDALELNDAVVNPGWSTYLVITH